MTTWPPIARDTKSAAVFDAAARDELLIKRCEHCTQLQPPEAAVRTSCGHTDLTWLPATGTGRLVSWTVVHRAPNRAYADLVPYTVDIVELSEGPWLSGRIDADRPHAGMPLHARFIRGGTGGSYPVFVTAA